MTMDEYRQSLKQMLEQECEKAKFVNKTDYVSDSNRVTVGAELSTYLSSAISNYVTNVSMVQSMNIRSNFPNGGNLGNLIGFVDTGLLLMAKKGKVGVAFYTDGIAQRSVMEKTDTAIDYTSLCRGVIHKQKKLLLAGHKFSYHPEKFIIIEPEDKMEEKLSIIRRWLLSYNSAAKSVYYACYSGLIDKIQEYCENGNFSEAMQWITALFEFSESNSENGYRTPKPILTVYHLLQDNFTSAMESVSQGVTMTGTSAYQWNPEEWKQLIAEKKNTYHQILNQQYYEQSEAYQQNGQIEEAFKAIHNALDNWSTVASWQLYANLIFENAKEENFFLHSELEYLTADNRTTEQQQVLEQEADRINSLKETYQEYIEKMKTQIVEKVKAGDIEFFHNFTEFAVGFSDDYGMNALMYAGLYQKKEIFDFLCTTSISKEQENVLDMNLLDLCILNFRNTGRQAYLDFVGDLDTWYAERHLSYKDEVQQAEKLRDESTAKVNSNSFLLKAAQKLYENAAPGSDEASKAWKNVERYDMLRKEAVAELERAEHILSSAEPKYRQDIQNHWKEYLDEAFHKIAAFSSIQVPNEIQSVPENAELEAYPRKYQNMFYSKRIEFIKDYISERLPELESQGEFETTASYQERQAQYEAKKSALKQEAESQFPEYGMRIVRKTYEQDMQTNAENAAEQKKRIVFARSIVEYFCTYKAKAAVLGKYNPDEQSFSVTWDNFWKNEVQAVLPVPVEIAPQFKSGFEQSGVPFEIDTIDIPDNKIQCHIMFQNENYPFVILKAFPEWLVPAVSITPEEVYGQIEERILEDDMAFFERYIDIIRDYTDEYGMNALMYATLCHREKLMEYLLEQWVDKKQENVLGMTASELYHLIPNFAFKFFSSLEEQAEEKAKQETHVVEWGWMAYWVTMPLEELPPKLPDDAPLEEYLQFPEYQKYYEKLKKPVFDSLNEEHGFVFCYEDYLENMPDLSDDTVLEEYLQFPKYQKIYDKLKKTTEDSENLEETMRFYYKIEKQNRSWMLDSLNELYSVLLKSFQEKQSKISCARKIAEMLWKSKDNIISLKEYHKEEGYFEFKWDGWSNKYYGRLYVPSEIAAAIIEEWKQNIPAELVETIEALARIPFTMRTLSLEDGRAECIYTIKNQNYPFVLRQRGFSKESVLAMQESFLTIGLHSSKGWTDVLEELYHGIDFNLYQKLFSKEQVALYCRPRWDNDEIYFAVEPFSKEELTLTLKTLYINNVEISSKNFEVGFDLEGFNTEDCFGFGVFGLKGYSSDMILPRAISKIRFCNLEKIGIEKIEKVEFLLECSTNEDGRNRIHWQENVIIEKENS